MKLHSVFFTPQPVRAGLQRGAAAAPVNGKVINRGTPPESFLCELIAWGKTAPDVIFARNNVKDIYSSVAEKLGPYPTLLYRRAVMLEVMRVLAGFESSWHWDCGRDTTNPTSNKPETTEAGAWQVSANSRAFGEDLQAISPDDPLEFQRNMKSNHPLAMEYIARLLRHTTRHNGPVKRGEIHPWLRRDAVAEFVALLS